MTVWSFAKGHGTLNDFVILKDRMDALRVGPDEVRYLCDRRAGIGGDGLLRVVKAHAIEGWQGDPELWFMDYRNADGSMAEMCGNGLRVFMLYLVEEGLVTGEQADIGTRAGVRRAWLLNDGCIGTTLGQVSLDLAPITVTLGDRDWPAIGADVGNPHAIIFVPDAGALALLQLTQPLAWQPAERFPRGVNVEFIHEVADGHIGMRVIERGVGETMSCGTGTVAAAAAYLHSRGESAGHVVVDVPGGRLTVELDADGQARLIGPAVIVARGEVVVGQPTWPEIG